MKTLALDLGNICGWAIMENSKLIDSGFLDLRENKTKLHLGENLIAYKQLLEKLIAINKGIDNIYYEHLEKIKGQHWNHQWNAYRGIMMTVAFENKLEINPVSAGTIKRNLTGNGRAEKKEMLSILNLNPIIKPLNRAVTDDNECDAIAIAMLAHDI